MTETGVNNDDEDVEGEQERVLSGDADDDLLRLENLTKVGAVYTTRLWLDFLLSLLFCIFEL